MKNIYLFIFSKFYYFSTIFNKDKINVAIAATGMLSLFPSLNILIICTKIIKISFFEIKNYVIVFFILLFALNLFLVFILKWHTKIEPDFIVSKGSKLLSNIFVTMYILVSTVSLFL
jgi:hypothetical protein